MRENELMDDRRLQLNKGNMFRFCKQNGMPKMPADSAVTITPVVFRTAWEIQRARVEAKKKAAAS